jgi:type II secretory pathway pseudopilin PulG
MIGTSNGLRACLRRVRSISLERGVVQKEFAMTIHKQGRRPGFTRTELLVVITIIGSLIGLIVPAIQDIRTVNAWCRTNNYIRQLIVATQNAHDVNQEFPPYLGRYPKSATGKDGTLYYHILPYIDGLTLYDNGIMCSFEPYVAPLDPTAGDGTGPNGVGIASFLCNSLAFPADPRYSRMRDSFPNGTSNTVFYVTATADGSGTWHYWGMTTPITATYFVGASTTPPQLPGRDGTCGFRLPCQLHPRGAMVAMGDASMRSVSPNIGSTVWSSVTNPANCVPIPSDWDQ